MNRTVTVTHDAEGLVFVMDVYDSKFGRTIHHSILRDVRRVSEANLRHTVDGVHHYLNIGKIINEDRYAIYMAECDSSDEPGVFHRLNRRDMLEQIEVHLRLVRGIENAPLWQQLQNTLHAAKRS